MNTFKSRIEQRGEIAMTVRHQNYINGTFIDSNDGGWFLVPNPAPGETLSEIPDTQGGIVGEAVDAAKVAQRAWEATPAVERAGHLRAIA
jgi:lactaldehyde dehydrogenase/glycolaldehyde dehydrogenase